MSRQITIGQPFKRVTLEEYQCTLSKESLEKAQKELNEDPKDRMNAVKALQTWIDEQPHFTFRTDVVQMLAFLRTAKFSQLRARAKVEAWTKALSIHQAWFNDVDSHDPRIQAFLDSGAFIPLPKTDKEGRGITLMRSGRVDLKTEKYSLVDQMRAHAAIGFYRDRDENLVVNGQIFILDFTGVTMKHILRESSDEVKKWNRSVQDNFPGRFKGFYLYNGGALVEAFLTILKTFLPKKYQERIRVFDTAEALYKAVGMEVLPLEYLPDDYKGPHAGTCEEILGNIKTAIMQEDYRQFLREATTREVTYDESKKPKDVPQASFRKLNID